MPAPTRTVTPNEHAFASYIRILGKGKHGSRSLTREEARDAMEMVLRGEATQVQIGALLMLLRVKEESSDELTGFVEAARRQIAAPSDITVGLDWSSYAGKGRRLPWYLLAAFTLADRGLRVFMHGGSGHTAGRIYSEAVLEELGVGVCGDWGEVRDALDRHSFAFMPLSRVCPALQALIDLRAELGLRSPVHTLVRLLNPLGANHSIQSIFHPPYAPRHQQAAASLGQRHAAVFKGEGGEVERKPEATCTVYRVDEGILSEQKWPRLVEGRQGSPDSLDVGHLRQVWRGEVSDEYGELAVIGTLAIAAELLGHAQEPAAALTLGRQWWQERDRHRIA